MDMRTILRGLIVITTAAVVFVACKQGDTDGSGNDTTPGVQYVSDGPAGSSLTFELEDDLVVGGTARFLVLATDPNGAPIPFLKITCDTEDGIAILEPSTGFEHTSQRGGMSGVLGGERPGSLLIECRAGFGTNLIVRQVIRVGGDGAASFPGSAGGGLGGGVVDDGDDDLEQVNLSDISFTTSGSSAAETAIIDTVRDTDCANDGNTTTDDLEPFTDDFYKITLANRRGIAVKVDSVEYSVSGFVSSISQTSQITISAGASSSISGPFTNATIAGTKEYFGTSVPVSATNSSISFTVRGSNLDGTQPFEITQSAVIIADAYDLCAE